MSLTSRERFTGWLELPGKAPKSEALEAVIARHVPATRRRLSFWYELRTLAGVSFVAFRDMGDAWDALSKLPEARQMVDDAGRLLAYRGKDWENGDAAEVALELVTARAGGRSRR